MISRQQTKALPLTLDDLLPDDRAEVEGFLFFLSTARSPLLRTGDLASQAPHRHLSIAWLDGLLTIPEGERIRDGRQLWQEFQRSNVIRCAF